ncbi:5099_t:CDS:2 [Gigaspora margarita]|uniref:5099_t:CDS:1 n=1 Tax=Gigaspora margarita TaxID=4874 RepID=A0ABM8W0W7_GIGMA|nr:5099_t:CDS:2 [Gigaspora margarita]
MDHLLIQHTQSHISDDHDKLGKCAKDALNDALNYFINFNCPVKTQNLKTFKEINTFLIHAHDQEFEPFFRLRKLSNISIPYKQGTIGGIIDLVQNLQTFRNMLMLSLNKIKEINHLFKMQQQYDGKESKKKNDYIRIPTLNTPLK